MTASRDNSDYGRIARTIQFIQTRVHGQPSLAECASEVGLSEAHFQRMFVRWAGISPKRFLQFLTLAEAKHLLDADASVLDASHAVGLSGGSRLHDLFIAIERMTPGQYKARAAGLVVHWSLEATPFGVALLAALDRGLCGITFVEDGASDRALAELALRWPGATLRHAPGMLRPYATALRARMQGREAEPIGVVLKGTPFQLQVWEALLRVPQGARISYGELAAEVGAPQAARAIGGAVGANPIAYLIPCHRVIRASSAFSGYRWGIERKIALLGVEYARTATG